MNTILWIATGLLALVALSGGLTKTFIPKEKLEHHEGAVWTRDFSPGFVKTLGALELLAAVGLILPPLVDVVPVMVPVTAVCWIALMIGAMITHGRLGQVKLVMINVANTALAVLIVRSDVSDPSPSRPERASSSAQEAACGVLHGHAQHPRRAPYVDRDPGAHGGQERLGRPRPRRSQLVSSSNCIVWLTTSLSDCLRRLRRSCGGRHGHDGTAREG